MSWYPLLGIVAALANLFLGFYILYTNPNGKQNRLFMLVSFSLAIWAFSNVLMFLAINSTQAIVFNKLTTFASSFTSIFLLHFFLVFANKPLTTKRLLWVYLPLLCYSLLDLGTHLITKSLDPAPWGYAVNPGVLYYFFTFTLAGYVLIAVYFGSQVYRKTKLAKEKSQALLISIAVMIPVIAGLSTEVIPGFFGIQLFPMTSVFSTAMAILIAYAINKYDLMAITLELAAENIIATMKDYLVVIDKENIIRLVNRSCLEVLGYQKEELVGSKLGGLFSGDETMMFGKNGILLPVLVNKSLLQIKPGVNAGWVLIAHDMRENRKMVDDLEQQNRVLEDSKKAMINILEDEKVLEEELKKEKVGVEKKVEERTNELNREKIKLTASISSLPIGFVLVDNSHNVVSINNEASNVLGLTKLKVKIFDDILSQFPKNSNIFKMHDDYHKEKKLIVKSGEIEFGSKILKISLVPIIEEVDKKKEVLGSILLVDDITEAKILDRSKDEFFSIASHELRTPLTAIRGNTSMILEYYAEAVKEPELKAMVDDIHESSIRLINIVNDFLNVSRLEQSRMVFNIKEFNIDELIPKIIKEYDVTGSRGKLSIDYVKASTPPPLVKGDSDKARQILINLLGNALKFTEKGGIKIRTEVTDKFVKILITDTGRGISLKQQSLLFHKFQQTGESLFTRDTAGGSGLGLYISKMMIEGMGGEIKLEKSAVGKGSVFSFTLPLAKKK